MSVKRTRERENILDYIGYFRSRYNYITSIFQMNELLVTGIFLGSLFTIDITVILLSLTRGR